MEGINEFCKSIALNTVGIDETAYVFVEEKLCSLQIIQTLLAQLGHHRGTTILILHRFITVFEDLMLQFEENEGFDKVADMYTSNDQDVSSRVEEFLKLHGRF